MDTIVDLLTIDTSKYFTTVTKLSPKNKDTQLLVLFYWDTVYRHSLYDCHPIFCLSFPLKSFGQVSHLISVTRG